MGKRSNKTKRQSSSTASLSNKQQVPPVATTRTGKILARCCLFLCVLIAAAFSIKTLYEPDIWWMLRTGAWIIENGYVPQQDVFSYTFSGAEWINVKWLYEVLIYGLQQVGGAPFVLVLQMAISVTIVILLALTYRLWTRYYENGFAFPSPGLVLALLLGISMMEFRMIGRPEAISHLMVAVFLYILMRYRFEGGKLIFLLLPLQVIWVNMHEGYPTGIAIMLAVVLVEWIEFAIASRFPTQQNTPPWYLTITTLVTIPALAIHPFGFEMILHPFNIFEQLQANKYTAELHNVLSPEYWHWQSYLNIAFFGIALIALFLPLASSEKREPWWLRPLVYKRLGPAIVLFMFFGLSLTAYRNIPFMVMASFPLLALGIDKGIFGLLRLAKIPTTTPIAGGLLILAILLYGTIPTNTYYNFLDRKDRYGLQVDATKNPVGATSFIKQNHLQGRCFSDYLTSSYLLWTLRPDFKTFIDLRDLDIFPAEFFKEFMRTVRFPSSFEQADANYDFDYAVLYRPRFEQLHQHLIRDTSYVLAFVDPVAAVYIKDRAPNAKVIDQLGIEKSFDTPFSKADPAPPSTLASIVNHAFWPIYEQRDYTDVNFDLEAAKFYYKVGNYRLSLEKAKAATRKFPDSWDAYQLMGNVYLKQSTQVAPNRKADYFNAAAQSYRKAIQLNAQAQNSYKGLGLVALQRGNGRNAITNFSQCIELAPSNIGCYLELAKTYHQLAQGMPSKQQEYQTKRLTYLQRAHGIRPDHPKVKARLGVAYCERNDCSKAAPLLDDVVEKAGLSSRLRQQVRKCLNNCQ